MVRKQYPGRELKSTPRANHTEASCQQPKLRLVEQSPLRQQLYGQKAEAVREDKSAQSRHASRVLIIAASNKT